METAICLKNRFPLSVRQIAAALLFLCWLPSECLNGAEPADVFRSDILSFYKDQEIPADSLIGNSFPVTLTCKTANPKQVPPEYRILLRNIHPVEKALFQEAQSGKWQQFDLFRAAMIAEGVRDAELIRAYEIRLDTLVARVLSAAQAEGKTTPQALTRSLFETMHRELLPNGYNIDHTELSKVMKTGYFNCVSATVLFNCLAEKAGLDVSALEMPGHALSQVRFADGGTMKLETTCPAYFDLQSDQERQMATLQRIAPAPAVPNPVTAQNAAAPPEVIEAAALPSGLREISAVQLVATIYYNIGFDLHAQKRYPEAAAANIKALYLDKDNKLAWTNLLASLNNWAALDIASERNRQYGAAFLVLDQGLALDPAYPEFRPNLKYVFYHWISGLANAGRFDDARKVYEISKSDAYLPGNEALQELIGKVNEGEQKIMRLRQR